MELTVLIPQMTLRELKEIAKAALVLSTMSIETP